MKKKHEFTSMIEVFDTDAPKNKKEELIVKFIQSHMNVNDNFIKENKEFISQSENKSIMLDGALAFMYGILNVYCKYYIEEENLNIYLDHVLKIIETNFIIIKDEFKINKDMH